MVHDKRLTLPERLGRALGAVAAGGLRRWWLALLIAAGLWVVGLTGARQLRLDTDLVNLLPRTFPSVQAMDELERRFWGMGYVSVVAHGAEPEVLKRFADEVAPRLEQLSTIRYVDYRRPIEFFQDHALYYLDADDLETIRDRLDARRLYEIQMRSPLMLGVEEQADLDKPAVDFADLEDKYASRLGRGWQPGGPERSDGYYLDPQRRMIVLLAKPARQAQDVGYADQVVAEVQAFVDGLELTQYGPGLQVELSGRYKKKIDQGRQVIADLRIASVLALLLMVLYLAVHFRGARAVLLVFVPLLVGVLWTFGFAGFVFGQLNLITGFIGAVQLGLGIDHGIHLIGRYDEERARGASIAAALEASFTHTGRAVTIAGLTTLVAFAGLGVSEYRAFREFGIIAAAGMVFVIGAYVLVLPALLGLGRWLGRSRRAKPSGGGTPQRPPLAGKLARWAPAMFWLAALGALAAVLRVPDSRFDYDFASLEDSDLPAFRLDKVVNGVLGHSQTPMVVLTDSVAEERQVVEALRARPQAQSGQRSTVQFVASVADLVPTEQPRKQRIIAEIDDVVRRIRPGWLEPEQRSRLDDVKRMTKAEPFGRADLPIEVRRLFQGPGAPPDSGFVLIYPSVSLADGLAVQALAREIRAVELPGGERLPLAGAAMVLADVLEMTKREAPTVIALALGLVFVVLLVLLRRLRDVAYCMGTAAVTLLVTVGLLADTAVKLNYLNIILIPVLFGIAVDGSVHLVSRLRESGSLEQSYAETTRAIAGSILTTALGFGAFLIANHPGLQSLGALAVLGLAVNLLVCLLLLPSLLALRLDTASPPLRPRWITLLATVGLAGHSPIAPGTMGALVALPLAAGMVLLAPVGRALMVVGLVLGAFWVVGRYLRGQQARDPQEIVLDEFVGCLVAAAFVPAHALWVAAAFVLFRLFDIWKPGPIRWIDRRLAGSLSVVGDDVAAGLLAGGLLALAAWAGPQWGWWA